MTAEKLFGLYLDANIILVTVVIVWFLTKKLIRGAAWRSAFPTQLSVLYTVLLSAILSPMIVLGIASIQKLGLVAPQAGYNMSDFLVAQYLDGNIAMAPSTFQQLLMLRTEWTHEIVALSSWTSFVVLGALITGVVFTLLRHFKSIHCMFKMIRESYVLRRIGNVDIRITHAATVPFSTRGLRRHYIMLPSTLLAQADDVHIAISHEIQHIRQKDLVWEIILEFSRPMFFWNPAFIYCKREVERLRELACDQQVLARSIHSVRDYCECLLRVCHVSLTEDRSNRIMTPSVPFVVVNRHPWANNSVAFLKFRVVSMLDANLNQVKRSHVFLLSVALVSTIASVSIAARPVTDWSQDRLMLSAIVNLERMNNRSGSGF